MNPDRDRLIAELSAEGLNVTEWSDDADTVYPEHVHLHREVRVVLDGEMTISSGGVVHILRAGDRLDLAPNEPHGARIGPDGVTYLAGTQA